METSNPPRPADYKSATRHCDVVMKGGITSGVVYPHAVCELAQDYRFKCVGGTSAGAIAAAATAAAEYGRDSEAGDGSSGFGRVAKLPDELGGNDRLLGLFQPQRSTRRLMKVLVGSLDHGIPGAIGAALTGNLFVATLFAAPGAALLVFSVLHWADEGIDALAVLGCVAGVIAAVLGAAGAVTLRLARILLRKVPDNDFGVCSGTGTDRRGRPALTPWLTKLLDECAGLGDCEGPLTFGQLWAGPNPDASPHEPPPEGERFVELQMMTTNLVNRTGRRIPWDERGWYFHPDEFRRLFPERVVSWMEDHAPPLEDSGDRRGSEIHRAMMLPRLPLPAPADLPVVVAARMSLSFPVLLSAVPLWAFDYDRPATAEAEETWRAWLKGKPAHWKAPLRPPAEWGCEELPEVLEPECCWFSDGGISSNFPIHFFDSLVPRRPTFGIDLRPFPIERGPNPEDQTENVKMVKSNNEEFRPWWYRLPRRRRFKLVRDDRLPSFLLAAVRTMQNRTDEAQMRAPGYRDRIAHVELSDDEGGMNLTMRRRRILDLSERGRDAAALLRTAYAVPPDPKSKITWDNHRWVRLRSALAALEQMHVEFATGFDDAESAHESGQSYDELLKRSEGAPPKSYRYLSLAERERALVEVTEILELGQAEDAEALQAGAPKPRPVGRIVPKE
jgi:predicted acylesterase/phospholipase RssA